MCHKKLNIISCIMLNIKIIMFILIRFVVVMYYYRVLKINGYINSSFDYDTIIFVLLTKLLYVNLGWFVFTKLEYIVKMDLGRLFNMFIGGVIVWVIIL